MKKIFLFLSFVLLLNAQDVSKTTEKAEDDSPKKLLELQERMKKTQEKVKKINEEDKKEKKQIDARKGRLNKLEKTVDELNGTLGTKK